MHMTCSQCGHGFCWLCLADWTTHGAGSGSGGFYKCNFYEKAKQENADIAKADEEMKNKEAELLKYQNHFSKFFHHSQSNKICKR